jgi:TrmH family RNA methyltransferase
MKVEKIHSRNAAFQKFEVLKTNRNKRFRYQEFFVEGVRNLNEAVRNGWSIASFLYTDEKPLSRWARELLDVVETDVNYDLPASLLAELSGKEDTSELLAVVKMREDDLSLLDLSSNPLLALFDRPSNHGNLGTVVRSCDALGVEALILTGHAVDPYDPAVVVASMGSFFNVPVIRVAESEAVQAFIDGMKSRYPRFQTVGTTAHQATAISQVDFTLPTLIMIGNETDGLCNAYRDGCDVLATIPMGADSSASSLNVACAATVVFYEAVRQRSLGS